MLNDLGIDAFVPAEDGTFISERHARIAEILHDYDPTMELTWIPRDKREPGDMPFAVVKTEDTGLRYVICYADESNCDERLLARVWSMDATKTDVFGNLEAHNAALEALKLKKQMEEMEEAHEISSSILRSRKNVYRHNGVVYQ
jgi:hypothetical protein